MADLRAYARETAARAGCDPDLFVRQIQQESGFNPDAVNAGSGAAGVAQIIRRWHPDVDPTDPIASLDYAARWMAQLKRQYGSYRMALAAYNWGPGNLAGWDGRRETLPAETRHYLDVILGEGWPEPRSNGVAPGNGSLGGQEPRSTEPGGGRAGTGPDATLHLRVATGSLNMRAEPSLSATVVTQLPTGTLVRPLGPAREADEVTWVQVRAAGGASGWMSAKYLEIVAATPAPAAVATLPTTAPQPPAAAQPPILAPSTPSPIVPIPAPAQIPSAAQYRLTESGVRLREQPGTGAQATVLAVLYAGALVDDDGAEPVQASGREWRRVRLGGRTGWIATGYLRPVAMNAANATDPGSIGGRGGRFDPATPTELQRQLWTCSIRSTMWLLKSIGVAVTPEEAQDAMSPRYCNSDLGLLDASGAGIVEVLRDRWGITAFNRGQVSFDEVAGWAGRCPVAIGGRNWGGPGFGHWSAVRGVDAAGNLVLANPGGTGRRFGQQTLDRDEWDRMGSFSAVVIPVE